MHGANEGSVQHREGRRPFLIHATVPLLGHHTSGVRREFYRDDLEEAIERDPLPRIEKLILEGGVVSEKELEGIKAELRSK